MNPFAVLDFRAPTVHCGMGFEGRSGPFAGRAAGRGVLFGYRDSRHRAPEPTSRRAASGSTVSTHRARRKSETMSTQYVSRYDARVDLVRRTLREHSNLEEKAAADLAVHVLHVLDHLPEQVR